MPEVDPRQHRDESALEPVEVAVALGSNLGDRAGHLAAALEAMIRTPGLEVLRTSRHFETPAWGPVPQPMYLNSACVLRTQLWPRALLATLHDIERSRGRDRTKEQRFGPRTLDLDIALFGQLCLREPELTIPHPRMHERRFVLEPLAEIAPEWRHPVLGLSVRELLQALR